MTKAEVCREGSAGDARDVSDAVKRQVYTSYGIRGIHHGRSYEVDHLISLELGGANDVRNLWPEAARPKPGYHEKDRLENALHRAVCVTHTMSLSEAQQVIRTNWLTAYRRLVR